MSRIPLEMCYWLSGLEGHKELAAYIVLGACPLRDLERL
jgi:hypothetical protein